jgi:excinuclease ABC subunit C
MEKEMEILTKKQDFERAAQIRDKIIALKTTIENAKILTFQEKDQLINKKYLSDWQKIQENLKKILNTKNNLNRIEAFDVSNIQGKKATGSMVVFIKGVPAKQFYRRFKIKIAEKPNDIAMIKEVITRRFSHPEWNFPNLILIDGGKAHLNGAKTAIKNLKIRNFKAEIISLAKKKNQLYLANKKKPLFLKNLSSSLANFLLYLRDQAHQFAISYHRKLREKI